MAEQDKKIYISVREFVNSWEKEIYQLTNLDLFAFKLINELAQAIEQNYFKGKSNTEKNLFLYPEEIGALCFNMADSLQLFFEKNCFGACNLNCPIELNKKATREEWTPPAGLIQLNIIPSSYYSKEQCLHHDMLNYVVVDSLLDFYNYEMGTVFDEGDEKLICLADFIVRVILNFIKSQGQSYLLQPAENASDSFHDLLMNDQSDWQDIIPDSDPADDEEPESWKIAEDSITKILSDFKQDSLDNGYREKDLAVIDKLKDYLISIRELDSVSEITLEDFGEFLTAVLPNEMIFADGTDVEQAHELLLMLAERLDFDFQLPIVERFLELDRMVFQEVKRTISIIRSYNEDHSYIGHLLSSSHQDANFAEGFMKVTEIEGGNVRLEDIHINTSFEQVDLGDLDLNNLQPDDILHLQLRQREDGWEMQHLEMVYCSWARHYLF